MTRAEREAQLISIAEEVLIERGYENTTVDEIAERAASPPVIYDHWPKDEPIGRVITRPHRARGRDAGRYEAMEDPGDARQFIHTPRSRVHFIDQHKDSMPCCASRGHVLGQGRADPGKQAELVAALQQTREFADCDERQRTVLANVLVAVQSGMRQASTCRPDQRRAAAEDVTELVWNGTARGLTDPRD